jgi:hypothetical protein
MGVAAKVAETSLLSLGPPTSWRDDTRLQNAALRLEAVVTFVLRIVGVDADVAGGAEGGGADVSEGEGEGVGEGVCICVKAWLASAAEGEGVAAGESAAVADGESVGAAPAAEPLDEGEALPLAVGVGELLGSAVRLDTDGRRLQVYATLSLSTLRG